MRMTKRQKMKIQILEIAIALLFILILLLVLLVKSCGEEAEEPVVQDIRAEEQMDTEAEADTEAVPEEIEPEEPVSTVKIVAAETDELTLGVDVSEYQGNIDWQQAAGDGLDFVMVRVGYRSSDSGEIKEDLCARYNLQEAASQGIYLGAYFFSTAVTEEEAREEAEWVCDLLAGYPITYPVAYNCEGFQSASSRQYGLTAEERTRIARAFLETVEEKGYTGMFYAARSELDGNALWETDELELGYRIWVAQYTSVDDPKGTSLDYSGLYAMWQYTNQGSVAGIPAKVDRNVAYFGYSSPSPAKAEGLASAVQANPEVGVTFEAVQEQVTAKDAANLRTTMDQGSDGNIAAQLQNGETALRTGKGNNGWSRVEYNGQTLYVVSSLLTTDLSYRAPAKEPESEFKTKFTAVSENVTAKEVTNLRNRPSVEEPSEVIAQLYNGEVIVRTGVSDVGWSRVEYNGQTLYCISSYLQVAE